MNEKILDFIKTVGVPSALVLALAYMMHEQQRDATKERADHTVILIDQMTALRKSCGCLAANAPEVDAEATVKAAADARAAGSAGPMTPAVLR